MSKQDTPEWEQYLQKQRDLTDRMGSGEQRDYRDQLQPTYRAGPDGREFDVQEPSEDEVESQEDDENDEARDGIVIDLKPIPRLKDLLDKLFPPRG